MADALFRRPYFWRRLRANPLGKLIEDYVAHFRQLGYTWLTVRGHAQALEHFGAWLGSRGLGPKDVSRELVRSFLVHHIPRCRCRAPAPCSLGQVRPPLRSLLRMLRERGLLNEVVRRWPIDRVLQQFDAHLREVCGLAEATRHCRLKYAREFLEARFGRRQPRWSALRPGDLVSFVTEYARRYQPASMHVVASSLRCFVRYLQVNGWCDAGLVAAVPRITHWRLAGLPKALTDDQVSAFLAAFDPSTPNGRRDRAMALCQIVLGMRVSEVANLRLDDIDWQNGVVTITATKTKRPRELPLPPRVGRAITEYLRRGRPGGRCRNVFVRHRGARGYPVTTSLIRGVMRLAYARARGCQPWGGTHVLRHTAATRMVRSGVRIKEIADVLGHRALDSTAIYSKVDLPALTAVAMPWPEVRP